MLWPIIRVSHGITASSNSAKTATTRSSVIWAARTGHFLTKKNWQPTNTDRSRWIFSLLDIVITSDASLFRDGDIFQLGYSTRWYVYNRGLLEEEVRPPKIKV